MHIILEKVHDIVKSYIFSFAVFAYIWGAGYTNIYSYGFANANWKYIVPVTTKLFNLYILYIQHPYPIARRS